MAAHTIYVSKAGLKVWHKAADLARKEGLTMSALIARELKRWVEHKEEVLRVNHGIDPTTTEFVSEVDGPIPVPTRFIR